MLDHLHEVEHIGERVTRLEQAIVETIKLASLQIQEVVKGSQALRGIAQILVGHFLATRSGFLAEKNCF